MHATGAQNRQQRQRAGARVFTSVCLSQPPGAGNQCLEIDGHDSYPLSPLGVWSCGGEFQQANEWWKLEPIMGHLLSMQSGGQPGEPSEPSAPGDAGPPDPHIRIWQAAACERDGIL